MALRMLVAEHRGRLHVELDDADVGRQAPGAQVVDVGQVGVVGAELALDEGAGEAALQAAAARGPRQRERRVQRQRQRGITGDPPVQRVEQAVRLAEPERRAGHDRRARAGHDALDAGVDLGEAFGDVHAGPSGAPMLARRHCAPA